MSSEPTPRPQEIRRAIPILEPLLFVKLWTDKDARTTLPCSRWQRPAHTPIVDGGRLTSRPIKHLPAPHGLLSVPDRFQPGKQAFQEALVTGSFGGFNLHHLPRSPSASFGLAMGSPISRHHVSGGGA
jgi:hypothetical protein